MIFTDIIYGSVEVPDWIVPFLKIPEFVRLRGVRLSNVDSYEFKDFNGPTRWEHCIGVCHLAIKLCRKKNLSKIDSVHLQLAALLHDVATPPFAHTIEYILEGYDHELESNRILATNISENQNPSTPIYLSQLPMFNNLCKKTSKQLGLKIDPDKVAEMVTGGGELGFLINGSIDLDNIDNVVRASLFLGIEIDKSLPYKLVNWLSGFDTVPTELESEENQAVQEWLNYRKQMYSKFYSSSDEELGRQAFLQHLIRRAYKQGMPRNTLLWNTDDGLLNGIEHLFEHSDLLPSKNIFQSSVSLQELVQRYRLLESPYKIIEIPVDDLNDFKIVKNPAFTSYLEDELTTPTFEPFVIVNSKRYNDQSILFNKEGGVIQIYKLSGTDIKSAQLPKWLQDQVPNESKSINLNTLNKIATKKVRSIIDEKPWLKLTSKRKDSIKFNLDNIGNWGFRLSRNEGLHSYPATFVHAIPAALINALCLKGELILDPFGGTGQTAVEALKNGCSAISSDSNSVASMITKSKLTYLTKPQRQEICSIDENVLHSYPVDFIPSVADINKWHHKKTQNELSKILSFIEQQNDNKIKQFYKVCFSDILTNCTARKGKEHGYFADNTPLSKGEVEPQYENAMIQMISKVKKNIAILERFYSYFESNQLSVKGELSNAKVIQLDITKSNHIDYGIPQYSVGGIITSPPYLCMADYTLGQRLSYYWLFPDEMSVDFNNEIGSRRSRMQNGIAMEKYLLGIEKFAVNAYDVLKKNGFLATVIGAPIAEAYNKKNVLQKIDDIFLKQGFELFWQTNRSINWHRNHGYARLKEERIAVHIKI